MILILLFGLCRYIGTCINSIYLTSIHLSSFLPSYFPHHLINVIKSTMKLLLLMRSQPLTSILSSPSPLFLSSSFPLFLFSSLPSFLPSVYDNDLRHYTTTDSLSLIHSVQIKPNQAKPPNTRSFCFKSRTAKCCLTLQTRPILLSLPISTITIHLFSLYLSVRAKSNQTTQHPKFLLQIARCKVLPYI